MSAVMGVNGPIEADGLGRTLVHEHNRSLAKGGTFVGLDRIGLEMLAPDARRADHVAALVSEGLVTQVCLSEDHVCTMTAPRSTYWVPPERRTATPEARAAINWQVSGRPYTYLMTDFVPLLVERGVSAEQVEVMLVDNPRQLLTGR